MIFYFVSSFRERQVVKLGDGRRLFVEKIHGNISGSKIYPNIIVKVYRIIVLLHFERKLNLEKKK